MITQTTQPTPDPPYVLPYTRVRAAAHSHWNGERSDRQMRLDVCRYRYSLYIPCAWELGYSLNAMHRAVWRQ